MFVEKAATITLTVDEWQRVTDATKKMEPFLAALILASLPCPACGRPIRATDSTILGAESGGRTWHISCWDHETSVLSR